MKKTILFIISAICLAPSLFAGSGSGPNGVYINANGVGDITYKTNTESWGGNTLCTWDNALTAFNGKNFGVVTSLILNGGVAVGWAGDGNTFLDDSFGVEWRVYRSDGSAPDNWNALPFDTQTGANGNDQRWEASGKNIDLLAGVTAPGEYTIDIRPWRKDYWNNANDSWMNNLGTVTATFTVAAQNLPLAVIGSTTPAFYKSGISGIKYTFDGNASLNTDSYEWTVTTAGSGNLAGSDNTSAIFEYTFASAGTYIITLTASASEGGTPPSTASKTIRIFEQSTQSNLVVGGAMTSADTWATATLGNSATPTLTWNSNETPSGANVALKINGVSTGSDNCFGLYQPVYLLAGKQYDFDCLFKDLGGTSNSWFQLYLITGEPRDDGSLDESLKIGELSTWGTSNSPVGYDGSFAAKARAADPGACSFIPEQTGVYFLALRTGTWSGTINISIADLTLTEAVVTQRIPVMLQVIDWKKGALSDAPGTWAYDANIVTWVSGDLNDGGYWFYGMFDRTVDWDGNAGNQVTFPRGLLVKDNEKWTWSATFDALPGEYEWNPMSILHGYASLNGYGGAKWDGDNMRFVVNADGTISGQTSIDLGKPIDVPADKIRVAAIGDSNTAGAGASNASQYAWPAQLATALSSDYHVHNFGVSGATLMNFPEPWGAWTNDKDLAYSNFKTYNSNVILVALGTNDSKPDYWTSTEHNFTSEYIAFIDNVKSFSTTAPEIYLITPLIALTNTYGIDNANIEQGVIPGILEAGKQKMAGIIDWNTLSANWTTAQLSDGVHAGDAALGLMAQKVKQVMNAEKPVIGECNNTTPLYAEYRWYHNGTLVANATSPVYTTGAQGVYNLAVKLTANSDDVIVSAPYTAQSGVTLGIETVVLEHNGKLQNIGIVVANGSLAVSGTASAKVSIYSMNGTLAAAGNLKAGEAISIATLPKGVYVCTVIDCGGNTACCKFVK